MTRAIVLVCLVACGAARRARCGAEAHACRYIETKMPADRIDGTVADGDRCDTKSDCAASVACSVDGQRNYTSSRAQRRTNTRVGHAYIAAVRQLTGS
jgi:hypothetical protein